MKKGFNLTVQEFRERCLNEVNQGIEDGIPVSVIQLTLENIVNNIATLNKQVMEKEQELYLQEKQTKESQVEWQESEE